MPLSFHFCRIFDVVRIGKGRIFGKFDEFGFAHGDAKLLCFGDSADDSLVIRWEFPRHLLSPLRNCHKSINFVVCVLYLKNLESVGKRI